MNGNRNGNKIALMAIAVVAIGMFALPSTVSLFSGQHAWYNISYGEKLPCIKCHADIYDEYLMTGVHGTLSGGSYGSPQADNATAACYWCHRIALNKSPRHNYILASGDDAGSIPGKEVHAASTVACMVCHEFGNPWTFPHAGGFDNVSGSDYNYDAGDPEGGTHAAHQTFVESAVNDTRMEDSNEACIACHTYIPVKINWTHAYSLEFNATYVPGEGYFVTKRTHFNVTDWSVNGTINVTSYGNASGGANMSYFPPPVTICD